MSDVLIRDVPPEDLHRIRAEASARGMSLQSYLREALRAQAAFLRRQEALVRAADRLGGQPATSEQERAAVLEAIDTETESRAADLGGRAAR